MTECQIERADAGTSGTSGTSGSRARADGTADRLTPLAANVALVRGRIEAAGGDPARITLVAVTKGFGPAAVLAAVEAGLYDLGDNYAQELLAKVRTPGLPVSLRWHFLGPVQRNKVAALSSHVDLWHSVDRLAVGQAIARHQPGGRVLVQVNVTGEASKHGCRPDEVGELVSGLRRLDIEVTGLMTIGPAGPPEGARPVFRQVADMARQLGLAELSMGMTDDLEVAIQEGATMVRIGRGLFGPRDRTVAPATIGSLNGGN